MLLASFALFACSLYFFNYLYSVNGQQFQNVVKKYIDCYECGVWRGSVDGNIGKPCLNPYAGQTYIAVPGAPIPLNLISIKHNCTICMKIDTWNRQGYQRPRSGYSSVRTLANAVVFFIIIFFFRFGLFLDSRNTRVISGDLRCEMRFWFIVSASGKGPGGPRRGGWDGWAWPKSRYQDWARRQSKCTLSTRRRRRRQRAERKPAVLKALCHQQGE